MFMYPPLTPPTPPTHPMNQPSTYPPPSPPLIAPNRFDNSPTYPLPQPTIQTTDLGRGGLRGHPGDAASLGGRPRRVFRRRRRSALCPVGRRRCVRSSYKICRRRIRNRCFWGFGGKVRVWTERGVFFAAADGVLYALSVADGACERNE